VLNVSLPSDNPVLDARSLSFPADGSVLRQVNLAVGEGETVAVHGPAGAGKTVLLGCLTGRLAPGSGSIWANGKAFHLFSADQRRAFQRRSFGLVPQQIGFVPELTLVQNTALPLLFTGTPREQAASRALVWLERFELGEYAGRRIGTLPVEALRRAALARGMVTDPLILFADEPLAGLAEAEVATIARMLLSIARSHGTAVVCFTREDTMAARFQRRVDLSHGRTPNQPVPTAPLRAARAPKPAPLQPTVVQQPAATVSVIGTVAAVSGASTASAASAVPTAPAEPLAHTSGPWAAHTSPSAPTTRPPTRPARNSGPTNVLLKMPADLPTAQSADAHDVQSAPQTPTASAAATPTATPAGSPPAAADKPVARPMPWTTPSRPGATPTPTGRPVARPMPWATPSRPDTDPAQRGPARPPIPPKDPRHRGGLPLGAPSQVDESTAQAQL
jgi:putative ABC transport system ATP-binding protein